jgi:hypothetical protein
MTPVDAIYAFKFADVVCAIGGLLIIWLKTRPGIWELENLGFLSICVLPVAIL